LIFLSQVYIYWEKVAMKYEVEIRRIVIYFCAYYSFLNYCIVLY
jgi:hypothetical protein